MADSEQPSKEDLAEVLKDLALRIDRLKQLYEQYFMGIERMEPMVARKEVMRSMLTLQQSYIRNTGLRFKFNTMLQKWSSYTTYWNRTLREIENGTYVRHLQKAARAAELKGRTLPEEMRIRGSGLHEERRAEHAAAAAALPEAPVLSPPASARAPATNAVAPGAPPRPVPAAAPRPAPPPLPGAARPPLPGAARPPLPGAAGKLPPALPEAVRAAGAGAAAPTNQTPPSGVGRFPPSIGGVRTETPSTGVPILPTPAGGVPRFIPNVPGMSEPELRALHKRYQEARTSTGDATPVRYETLVASLAKQAPKVLEQPGVRGVKFDVAVKDGKAVLKATPTR